MPWLPNFKSKAPISPVLSPILKDGPHNHSYHTRWGCTVQETSQVPRAPLCCADSFQACTCEIFSTLQEIPVLNLISRSRPATPCPRTMAGGRKSRSAGPVPPSITLVLDNGADTIKAGFVTSETLDESPRVIPNCIARDRQHKSYVGSELAKCKDFGEIAFRRPVEKGYIVNWEAQKEIWDREFFDDKAPQKCDPAETRLLLGEHSNSLPALQTHCDQVVFEEYGFASYYRGAGMLALLLLDGTGC